MIKYKAFKTKTKKSKTQKEFEVNKINPMQE